MMKRGVTYLTAAVVAMSVFGTAFAQETKLDVPTAVETEVESETEDFVVIDVDSLIPNEKYEYVVAEDDVLFRPAVGIAGEDGVMYVEVEPFSEWVAVILDDGIWAYGIDETGLADKFGLVVDKETGKYDFPKWEADESESDSAQDAGVETESESEAEVEPEAVSDESEVEEPEVREFAEIRRGVVDSRGTELRIEPNSESDAVASLENGNEFDALGIVGDEWILARFGEEAGYVNANDVLPKRTVETEAESETKTETETEVESENPSETEVESDVNVETEPADSAEGI